MPKGFAFPTNEELWIPLFSEFPPRERNDPAANNPAVLGLLKAGVSLDQANAEATTIARRFAAAYPDTNKQFNTGQVQPLLETFTPRPLRGTLWTMLGFCVGVLLISCVNVMNMQFARATLRAKELAVRSSLGATRIRLIRQMLTESLLVAVIGAAAGVALAYASTDWLSATVRNLENPPPSWITFDVDGPALLFTVLATLAAAVFSGLLPAVMSSRANAVDVLRDAGRGNTSRSVSLISRSLVVFQIVVTCVLLDRLAPAAAIDHQPADDRLRLRHRRRDLGADGADGRRLSVAGRAQGVLRAGGAGLRGGRPGRSGGADQPFPHGVLRQRPDRDRRQDLPREPRSAERRTSSR